MVQLKRLFEVTVAHAPDSPTGSRVWLVLADHTDEATSLISPADSIQHVEVQPGLLAARGPSRVIGWTIDRSAELANL
ncbi:MAG: hypothetical protein CMM50_16400 [Rhodospirillaceae bacterium]|nr:hypothetical protein [Rhodospirillaceae bacterium]|tara:strand:+ start:338 stop:571 length:234 start_codon:yes stop_codon:yes gene_type:complete